MFERTHCGLVLTKAGESLYQDAKYIIRYCKDSVICAQNAMNEGENIIRIGSSPMTPAQLLMHRGWSNYVDRLRDDIWQNHSQINIVDFDFYSMNVFNRCENTNDVLLAIPGWENVHPLLKVIPVEWEHSITYGLLHALAPSETVKKIFKGGANCYQNQIVGYNL